MLQTDRMNSLHVHMSDASLLHLESLGISLGLSPRSPAALPLQDELGWQVGEDQRYPFPKCQNLLIGFKRFPNFKLF